MSELNIVNIDEPSREMPRLISTHILDAEPFEAALQALGVDPADLPNWTIYSGRPQETVDPLNPRAVVLRASNISMRMAEAGVVSDANSRRSSYVNSFKPVAAKVVLETLALRSIGAREVDELPMAMRHRKVIKTAGTLIGLFAGNAASKYGMHMDDLGVIGAEVAGIAVFRGMADYIGSPLRHAKRAAKRVAKSSPDIVASLEKSILPVFDNR